MKCINCSYFISCNNANEKLTECEKYMSKREGKEKEEYINEIKKLIRGQK